LRNLGHRLLVEYQFWDLRVMLPHSRGEAGGRPTEPAHRFYGHQAVGHIGQDMRGSERLQLLLLGPLHQTRANRAVFRMIGEVVDQQIRIEENGGARGNVVKCHGDSTRLNSGSVASRSRVSASPVQGIIPAVCWARLGAARSVPWTISC